jgi:hypothetical protein
MPAGAPAGTSPGTRLGPPPGTPPAAAAANAQVLALHRQGFEPKIIAAKTGSTLGEIELIISLADGGR